MTTGGSAHDADPRRIDSVAFAVVTDVANRRTDVSMDLRDGEQRLGAMHHVEHRVAAPQQFRRVEDAAGGKARQPIRELRRQKVVPGCPSAAHHRDHGRAVDVSDGRHPVAVDQIHIAG